MNNRGNVMLSLFFFLMALGIMVVFVSPINDFINLMQQSDSLNCRGYIHNGNVNNTLSFNSTLNGGNSGSPLSCLALKLYLPYILLTFLIAGLAAVMGGRAADWFGLGGSSQQEGF
jgi:hypothetical protein